MLMIRIEMSPTEAEIADPNFNYDAFVADMQYVECEVLDAVLSNDPRDQAKAREYIAIRRDERLVALGRPDLYSELGYSSIPISADVLWVRIFLVHKGDIRKLRAWDKARGGHKW
jgi:hypothetical protein